EVPLGRELTVQAWLCPTAPEAGEQGIAGGAGWQLLLRGDGLALRVGGAELATRIPLRSWEWHFIAAVVSRGRARLVQRPLRAALLDAGRAEAEGEVPLLEPASARIL